MKTPPSSRKRAAGFNLLELLTVMSIAGILMAVGVPSFRYVTNSNRVSSEINGLLGDLQLARAEAIKQGQSVTACPSTDQKTCAGGTDWSQGWIVFSDFNGNGTVETDSANNDTVLRVQPTFTSKDTLQATSKNGGAAASYFSFNRDGFATKISTDVSDHLIFKLNTTPAANKWLRCLDITRVGAMATARDGGTNCAFP